MRIVSPLVPSTDDARPPIMMIVANTVSPGTEGARDHSELEPRIDLAAIDAFVAPGIVESACDIGATAIDTEEDCTLPSSGCEPRRPC